MIEGFLVILCFLRSGNLVIAVVPKKTRVGFVRTAVIGIVMCVCGGATKSPSCRRSPCRLGRLLQPVFANLYPKKLRALAGGNVRRKQSHGL